REMIRDVVREEIRLNIPVQNKEKVIFTAREAAEYLRISINTLYKKNTTNAISYDKQSKHARYRKEDLDNYLKNSSRRIKSENDIANEINSTMNKIS
ncbi:MAG: helix-turn-helix domain-containing protein, partial [FCB group bacterium]